MKRAGGITSLVAGIFGVVSAMVTLFVGGLGSAFGFDGYDGIVSLGWGGMGCSFLTVILASITLGVQRSMAPGILLIVCAGAGVVLGGALVAVCMALAAAGGVMVVVGTRRRPMSGQLIPPQQVGSEGGWRSTSGIGVVAPGPRQKVAPGWYSDPSDRSAIVWWDGGRWIPESRRRVW